MERGTEILIGGLGVTSLFNPIYIGIEEAINPTPKITPLHEQVTESTSKPKLTGAVFEGRYNDTQVAKGVKKALQQCKAKNATMTREPVTGLSQTPLVSFKTECR